MHRPADAFGQASPGFAAAVKRARAYLEILKIRMGPRLNLQIDVPKHLLALPFPTMMLQTLVETLLFYHPAVWWLSRRIRIEREQVANRDLALGRHADVLEDRRAGGRASTTSARSRALPGLVLIGTSTLATAAVLGNPTPGTGTDSTPTSAADSSAVARPSSPAPSPRNSSRNRRRTDFADRE